jgi:hypothetical protein
MSALMVFGLIYAVAAITVFIAFINRSTQDITVEDVTLAIVASVFAPVAIWVFLVSLYEKNKNTVIIKRNK